MKRVKGFTLIELMVTVAILAIIVSIAMPSYSSYVIRGKIPDATSGLASKRVQMEQYYQDNRTYANAPACNTDTTTSKYYTFTCPVATWTQNTYTIVATGGNAVSGNTSMNGFIYTVDQANNKQTTGTPAGWGAGTTAPAGQIPPNPTMPCWVVNKGGAC